MIKKLTYLVYFLYCFICMAQTGNVGISTSNPQETLHVKGSLRLEHPSQSQGKIIQVYKDGSMKWSVGVPSMKLGVFTNGNPITAANIATSRYFNAYIDLAPGKWLVRLSLLIPMNNAPSNNNSGYLVETHFADSSDNTTTPTMDYITGSSTKIIGTAYGPSDYGMVLGSVLLENKDDTTKRYYLHGTATQYSTSTGTLTLNNFTSTQWGENRMYALPIE